MTNIWRAMSHLKRENMGEATGIQYGATTLNSRRLKRKSEEGSVANNNMRLTSPEDERLRPKLRKYSRSESENQAEEITEKKNDFALPTCEFTEKTLKLSHTTYTTKTKWKDRKKPLVPQLQNLNEDENSSNCVTGFILSPQAERPYKCNLCVKQFKYFSNLKSHLKIVHKKVVESSPQDSNSSTLGSGQVFQCEICFRNFKYFSNLRTHRLVHTINDSNGH